MRLHRPLGLELFTLTVALMSACTTLAAQTLADRNGDKQITVCLTGDSKMNSVDNRLAEALQQPDNVLQCGRDGATTLDVFNHINTVLSGDRDIMMRCRALKGSVGAPCDYVVYEAGINSFMARGAHPPAQGKCFNKGDPSDGQPCHCDWEWQMENPTPYFCREGPDFLRQCCEDVWCPQRVDCRGEPSGQGCDLEPNPPSWCTRGCRNSPQCPAGLCVERPQMPRQLQRQALLMDRIQAHPSHAIVVLVLPPPTLAINSCWNDLNAPLEAITVFYQEQAQRRKFSLIDLRQEFYEKCEPLESCYMDPVHYSSRGVDVLSRLIEACLEHDPAFRNAHCDGL